MKTNKLLQFKVIKDLLYYDGPLLSLGVTEEGEYVLESWCDRQDNRDIYCYIFIQKEDFRPFIRGEKSFFNVIKDCEEIVTFDFEHENFNTMAVEDYLKEYGPEEEAQFMDELIDFNKFLSAYEVQHGQV